MFVTIFVLALMDPALLGQGGQGLAKLQVQVITICVVMLLGVVLSSIITLMAVGFAWISKSRLWIDPSVHQARLENLWPPSDFGCSPKNNKAERLVSLSLLMLGVPFWFIVAAALTFAAVFAGDRATTLALIFAFLGVIVIPVTCWALRNLFERTVFASLPSACWNSPYSSSED
jgi:hypothetical protein